MADVASINAATANGVDPSIVPQIAQVESGGDPNSKGGEAGIGSISQTPELSTMINSYDGALIRATVCRRGVVADRFLG